MTAPVDVPTGNTYEKYESTHPVERRLVAAFLRALERALPAAPPRRVLEVGAGEGVIAERVGRRFGPGAAVVGVDLGDPHLVAHWRERGLRGVFADAGRLPFAPGAFDLVLAIEVLEHLADPAGALREIRRVASGTVVLSVPREPLWRLGNLARRRYWDDWGNTPGHVQHWTTAAFCRLVSQHLRIEAVWRPFPWTMVLAETRRR